MTYQAKLLGEARVEVIALAQTSASLFADDYDAVTVKRMTEASGVPCLTSAQAIGRALKALKAPRVAMATPYSEEVIGRTNTTMRRSTGSRWSRRKASVPAPMPTPSARWTPAWPKRRFAGSIGRISTRWWCRAAISRPWTGLPAGSASCKPVITTNQAALWAVLQTMKFDTPLPGKGRLLEQLPAG